MKLNERFTTGRTVGRTISSTVGETPVTSWKIQAHNAILGGWLDMPEKHTDVRPRPVATFTDKTAAMVAAFHCAVDLGAPVRIVPADVPADMPFDPEAEVTRLKIQIEAVDGWADLKSSTDGEHYEVEEFDSYEKAVAEAKELQAMQHNVRVVPFETPAEGELYCE